MKKIKVILFLLLGYGSIYAQNQENVSISFKNITIENAIKQLESQLSNLNFSYSNNLPDLQKNINKNYINKPINNILTDLFSGTFLSYKQIGNTIVILKNNKKKKTTKKNKVKINKTILF